MRQPRQDTAAFSREEPLPGYVTGELLGRGGFGEVWKAVAPGGVSKAIKFVFGDDPSRTDSELRSLNRIKDVRHPLILSIDRIEVVKETLIIVTELGDCNLKEYCQRFRKQGHVGIPQEALLELMRDAAEALDFIYTEHALQHLDVKPENFLVFGRHLKIADFGVVKHIYERSASLVHGLTPIFAAPESFEGKANRHTDQYSLAIVYQQMLTGTLPFDGLSAARLATQHLKEPPNLHPLPPRQQPIIARALSKDPNQRFESCVGLVEELKKAASKSSTPAAADGTHGVHGHSPAPLISPLSLARPPLSPAQEFNRSVPRHEPPASAPTEKDVRPFTEASTESAIGRKSNEAFSLRPTIIIGIGGTAAHVLQQLRSRINERLGRLREAPALQLLLIDSDVRQLNQINRDEDVWKEIETVATPLRKPDEYRAQDTYLKRWINRRWLYNIPRDQSTEGIRPLGRLALVSSFKRVFSAIQKSLDSAITTQSAAETSQSLGRPFVAGSPRVIVLASISGGTGSGMLFDVAYAVRRKLSLAGVDDAIESLLLHSTPRNKGGDKAIANAYATLQELEHYSRRGNYYPGDAYLGIDAFHGNNRTFKTLDFVHLGDNLDEQQWQDCADDVAEFLFCSVLNASPSLSNVVEEPPQEETYGRTISIHQLGAANRGYLKDFSSRICLDLLDCWRGREIQNQQTVSFTQPTTFLSSLMAPNAAKHKRLTKSLDQHLERAALDVASLLGHTRSILTQELGQEPNQYLEAMLQESPHLEDCEEANRSESALALIDHVLTSEPSDERDAGHRNTLQALIAARLETYAGKLSADLKTWIHSLVNDSESRVDGAQFAAEEAQTRLRDMQSAVAREKAHVREAADGIKLAITGGQAEVPQRRKSRWNPFRSNRPNKTPSALVQYGQRKIEEILLTAVHKQLRTIEAQIGVTIDQIQRLSRDLTRLSNKFETRGEEGLPNSSSQSFDESVVWYVQGVRELLKKNRVTIIRQLEEVIENTLSGKGYTLQRFLDHHIELGDVLLLPLRERARDVVSRGVARIHCELIEGGLEPTEEAHCLPLAQIIQHLIKSHWNGFTSPRERFAVIIPESADSSKLLEQFGKAGGQLSVLNAVTNGITLVREVPRVSLAELAHDLTKGESIYKDLASRLHTRMDVDWTPLGPNDSLLPTSLRGMDPGVHVDQTAVLNQ